MKYSPEFPQDTKRLRSCSGNRATMRRKVILEANVTQYINTEKINCTNFQESGWSYASILTFFVRFYILFHSCCSHARVLWKNSCMSSQFPMAMLNGTFCFRETRWSFRSKSHLSKTIIIYHDFLPTPRRGSHVKSGKTHTQLSRYTP